jgi:hypothetical protein
MEFAEKVCAKLWMSVEKKKRIPARRTLRTRRRVRRIEKRSRRENLIAHGMRTKLFERDAKKMERVRNYNPSHKSELRKYHDSSGAKALSFLGVFGTAEAVPS